MHIFMLFWDHLKTAILLCNATQICILLSFTRTNTDEGGNYELRITNDLIGTKSATVTSFVIRNP